MKQTAVEWLVEKLSYRQSDGTIISHHSIITKLVEQALEMEKEQIMDASYYGHLKGWVDDSVENSYGEQYYNETFKSE